MRHWPLRKVGQWVKSVVRGWDQYYAVPGNFARLRQFRVALMKLWLRQIRRRSQKEAHFTWKKLARICQPWFPPAKIRHPYPNQRLIVR